MHCLPGQPPRYGARPMPLVCPKPGQTSSGPYVWRRTVGLSALFDPLGIDVTQTTIPKELIIQRKLHPEKDVGWIGPEPERWGTQTTTKIGLDDMAKCNGRLRQVHGFGPGMRLGVKPPIEEGEGGGGGLGLALSISALPKDETEDIPMRPWVRKEANSGPWKRNESIEDLEEVLRGVAPARLVPSVRNVLMPSRERRTPAVASSPFPCGDGRRQASGSPVRNGKPFNLAHLKILRERAMQEEAAVRCGQTLQALIKEMRSDSCPPELRGMVDDDVEQEGEGSFVGGGRVPGKMRAMPQGLMTETYQQQLLSPGGELLTVYGDPREDEFQASPQRFAATHAGDLHARQDGTVSSPIMHINRKHLGHLPRSYASVVSNSGMAMSMPLRGPSSSACRTPTRSSPEVEAADRLVEASMKSPNLSATYSDWAKLEAGDRDTQEVLLGKMKQPKRGAPLDPKLRPRALSDKAALQMRASMDPYPKGYSGQATFKVLSGDVYGGHMLGTRSDQGGSMKGSMNTMGRFSCLDHGRRKYDGLPPARAQPLKQLLGMEAIA